jgi:hypothetical protein
MASPPPSYPSLNQQWTYNGIIYVWNGNTWVETANTNYSFNQIQINGVDSFNSFKTRNINFQGINLVIYSGGGNTIVFSAQPQTNSSSTFSGGTVSGPTNFTNGLSANTIYATTYQNLPTFSFTGGTVNGPTNFTNGLTANTISATTVSAPTITTSSVQNTTTFRFDIDPGSGIMQIYNNGYLTKFYPSGQFEIPNNILGGTFGGNQLQLGSSATLAGLRNNEVFIQTGTGGTADNTFKFGANTFYSPAISASTITANTFSSISNTISGTKGSVVNNGSTTTAFISISGSNTVGGTGYTDFIRVTNTAAGATNPIKTIRVNNTGTIEFLDSAYTTLTFTISDNGIVTINSPASVTSNSATNNALNVGTKGQLFDDGNLHIHGSSGSVWINSLDGSAIRLGTQTNSGNSTVIVDTSTVGHSFFTKVQSGFNVAFGTEITMDNLKVRINGTGGSGGLVQAGSVSGSFDAYTTLLGNVSGSAIQGDTNSAGITFTTSYQNISSSQKTLSAGGDTTTLHLIDTTNSRIYRITAIHCQGTTGGYTSIERMA